MRRRGTDSWELRAYWGIDPKTGRERWLTKTVHGTSRFARRQLDDLVVEAGRARLRAGTLADLLDQWFEAASPGWAPSTVSHTRSIIDCHLKPHIGHLDLDKLTTADIDDVFGYLLRAGSNRHGPLAPGTVTRVHGVLHRALAQAGHLHALGFARREPDRRLVINRRKLGCSRRSCRCGSWPGPHLPFRLGAVEESFSDDALPFGCRAR